MSHAIDVLIIVVLFLLFSAIHSITASIKLKGFFKKLLGEKIAFYRFGYNLISLFTFLLFWVLSPKPEVYIYDLAPPWDIVVVILQISSLVGFIWTLKFFNSMDFLGINQIKRHLKGEFIAHDDENPTLNLAGPYKISRHPLYLFAILFLVFRPYMSLFYFVFLILTTAYFWIGSYFEEKRLLRYFPDEYSNYMKKVSRIFPYRYLRDFLFFRGKIFLIVCPIITFYSGSAYADLKSDSVLVDLGSKIITVDEFHKRFELTPWPRRNVRDVDDEIKSEFLNTLIAEKLMAIESENIRIDTSFALLSAYSQLKKMFVRDALYKNEIQNKVKITKEDSDIAFAKSLTKIFCRFIFANDSAHVYYIYNRLVKGENFDSILSERPEFKNQKNPLEVTYGTLPEEIENIIYRTEPKDFTPPVQADYGYYIFRVDSSHFEAALGSKESNETYRKSQKILKERLEHRQYNEYFNSFFSSKKGEADGTAFWVLADPLIEILQSKFTEKEKLIKNKSMLDPNDVDRIEDLLGAQVKMTLIKIDNRKISIGEFLRAILFKTFSVEDSSREYIARKISQSIKSFMEDELLAAEGYKQGLQHSPEVKSDLDMWKGFYYSVWLNHSWRSQNQVSDSEIEEYLNSHSSVLSDIVMINIQEILVDSLNQIEELLRQLSNGANFGELASKYSKRKWAAEKNGEFGFFPSTMYDEIGKAAAKMEVGEIYAPIESSAGYSIIKLLDKKKEPPNEIINFEAVKEKYRSDLFEKKFNKFKDKYVAKLAQKYIKNINYELLSRVKVSSLNMFAYRFMGFGGRISAVPLINRYTSWYDEWQKLLKKIP
jgi:parvulin-like peptidyl-prolyl isomerase/protein-S-isoprenylcysteine O-methyltransferase Ste14